MTFFKLFVRQILRTRPWSFLEYTRQLRRQQGNTNRVCERREGKKTIELHGKRGR